MQRTWELKRGGYAARKHQLLRRNRLRPQPSGPATIATGVSYGVRMRNTVGPMRGAWATYALAAREGAGLSRPEMARRVGVDRVTVWRWETGKQRPEDVATAQAFAVALGLDLDEVLAAAGLRPGITPPTEPTREVDEELEMILASSFDNRTKMRMIKRLEEIREQDRQRRMAEIQFWLGRDAG